MAKEKKTVGMQAKNLVQKKQVVCNNKRLKKR
jgi:hypothetical protein